MHTATTIACNAAYRSRIRRAGLTVLLAALLGGAPLAGDTIDVYVYSFEFSVNPPGQPIADAVITVGDSVRWVWVEGNHTTTAVGGIPEQWDAVIRDSSPTFTHTFTTLGTWHYYCQPHGFDNGDQTAGGMAGTITVLPGGTGACCQPSGLCEITTQANCASNGGTYQGSGTSCIPSPCSTAETTVSLPAAQDCVLYENANGSVANGAGSYIYVGEDNSLVTRRGLFRFDLSAIPPGALVTAAEMRLYCGQAQGSATNITAHRVLASWSEGASDPSGNESGGTSASTGDSTWLHRLYSGTFWTVPGGDFAAVPSATVSITTTVGLYIWTSSGLMVDVQAWVDTPASNYGWMIRGNEIATGQFKRFESRQSGTPANWPTLVVTYLPPVAAACCLPSGSCVEATPSGCVGQGGVYQGAGTTCGGAACPIVLEPFVDQLPLPGVAQPVSGTPGGAAHYEIDMLEVTQKLHRDLPMTRVWGYAGSYPGPTIEARRDEPVTVIWRNQLRDEQGNLRMTHPLSVDTCLHGPDISGEVPVTAAHLHGGHVAPASDGYPKSAFPPGQQSAVFTYPNNQPAGTIWYHDHGMGITRLNVYMGLAGYYLIRDDAEDALNIPRGEFEIPLAIQDRTFNPDGSLKYHNMWMDHFVGDKVLVNGKVWPYLNVKQGKYRFRMLNGSNTRAYTLTLSDGAAFWQIGTDDGLLAAPVALTSLTIVPGERADVVMDFAPYAAGTEIILSNSARAPHPAGPPNSVIPNVMKFIVTNEAGDTDPLPASLVPVEAISESEAVRSREFELLLSPNTDCPEHDGGMWTINGLMFDDVTEFPTIGTTEIWAWKNRSSMTHPMHMHLVAFQVLDRQDFDPVSGLPTGPRVPPPANELGWKDTVQAFPSQITRVIARFDDYMGLYPYHCHILEHEDHEMMRQFRVVPIGDLDYDCDVDLADLTALLSSFGCSTPPCVGDLDNNGVVELSDLTMMLSQYGVTCD